MSKKFKFDLNGKGYYIALALCAIAIGVSGYLYYANAADPLAESQDPALSASVPEGEDVQQVIATQPSGEALQSGATVATQPQPSKTALRTVCPVQGQTVAVYAVESLSYNQTTRDWRVHNGVDIAAEEGAQVCAAADGTVYTVYEDSNMGMTVVIRHDGGYVTTYSSLGAEVSVQPGDEVSAGQAIGCAGSSALLETAIGSHVHFAVTRNGESVDPADFLAGE